MVDTILSNYNPNQSDELLVVLQELSNHTPLSEDVLLKVAKHYNMSPAKVFGVATFYSFLPVKTMGKYIIRICRSVSCDLAGKEEIIKTVKQHLNIKNGQSTSDGLFTLIETNCLGWCDEAPAMLINNTPYTNLTKEKVLSVLNELKQKND